MANTMKIVGLDDQGRAIYERRLEECPLAETSILALSREYFNDPEPCMIHRSAVMNRMFHELEIFLESQLRQGCREFHLQDLPEPLCRYLDRFRGLERICVK